ncbi:ABC transporter ATP-binding protein [uncultured Desulfobacter sp.]|uniref:ABC transporter ATP-binding protein n=1 Tax=uncultured Desulfobacter sp. TaxID=240139 RepID=UPI0029F548D2|nr:ABC transporter ATP-binding protein [uncultured Desulfobacter sp.]
MKIHVENLYFSYPGKDVLKGISFSLDEKQIQCIVGPNGTGKSTLVKCIDRLLIPQSGNIFFNGKEYATLNRQEIAKLIGYVPQSSGQLFSTTVFDTVLMGRKPHYFWRCSDEDIDIVAEILQLMGLDDLAMVEFNRLSGGQQQRVLIARALAQKPRLLLLDEPTSSLDISHQLEIMEIIYSLVCSQNIAVIMVVHDLNLAARYADTILMLYAGKVYANGSAQETITASNIKNVYGVEANIHSQDKILSVTPVRRV